MDLISYMFGYNKGKAHGGGGGTTADMIAEGGHAVINLPNATKIKDYAFFFDLELTSVNAPSATNVGGNAFNYCRNLVQISIPTATNISMSAFKDCKNLEYVEFSDDLEYIEENAFENCEKLQIRQDFPRALLLISDYTFAGCKSLKYLDFPRNLEHIYDSAFRGCTGLLAVSFLGTPEYIDEKAFILCPNLANIYVPWAEGEVAGAPWGAENATIHYNCTFE